MSLFILGSVVGLACNFIAALFSRQKALKLLPWIFMYIGLHGSLVFVFSDFFVRGSAMNWAQKIHPHWMSYAIVMIVGAVLTGVWWKAVNIAADRVGGMSNPPITPPPITGGIPPAQDTFMQFIVDVCSDYLPLLTPGKPTAFNIAFINNGSFPAHRVFSGGAMKIADSLSPATGRALFASFKQEFQNELKSRDIHGITIGVKTVKLGTYKLVLSKNDVDAIYAGKKFIYVMGSAKWASSQGESEEEACFVLQTPYRRPLKPKDIVWRTCEGALQVPAHE